MANWRQSTRLRWMGKRFRFSRKRAANQPKGGLLTLSALKLTVPADMRLVTPTMRVAVVEDLCWAVTRADWLNRRPAWWRRAARRAWQAEETALTDKQGRIAELVALAGKE